MICHVKTLDTWANRTWKWSEIMILTNIGWILKYKYLFNHPILSSLLRLHLCWVNIECDCVMCATCFTTLVPGSVPCLLSWISSSHLSFCPLLQPHQAYLTLHISPPHSTDLSKIGLRFALPALTLTVSWEAPIGSQKQPHINQWGLKGDPEIKSLQTSVWKQLGAQAPCDSKDWLAITIFL